MAAAAAGSIMAAAGAVVAGSIMAAAGAATAGAAGAVVVVVAVNGAAAPDRAVRGPPGVGRHTTAPTEAWRASQSLAVPSSDTESSTCGRRGLKAQYPTGRWCPGAKQRGHLAQAVGEGGTNKHATHKLGPDAQNHALMWVTPVHANARYKQEFNGYKHLLPISVPPSLLLAVIQNAHLVCF